MLTLSALIFAFLVIASLIVGIKLSIHSSSELIVNRTRIQTWWVICLICIPVFYMGGWALTLLIYSLTYWIIFEFSRMQNHKLGFIRIVFFTVIILGYDFIIDAYPGWINLYYLLPIFFLLGSFLFSGSSASRANLILLFCVTSIQTIQLIPELSQVFGYEAGLLILFVFFITSVNDIMQYLCGKLMGRTPLAPSFSPNKTIEGALGGMLITSLIVSFALPNIINITWVWAMLVGLFISMLGIIGDLNLSYFKRIMQVKDSGTALPGHGGLLDRIDSLTLTLPGFGLFLNVFS